MEYILASIQRKVVISPRRKLSASTRKKKFIPMPGFQLPELMISFVFIFGYIKIVRIKQRLQIKAVKRLLFPLYFFSIKGIKNAEIKGKKTISTGNIVLSLSKEFRNHFLG